MLKRYPHSGEFIQSDGSPFSLADMMAFRNRYDLLTQTIDNGAVELGKRCLVSSAVSTTGYYYGLDIPEGRRLFIWQRILEVTEGQYAVDLVSVPGGFTGGTLAYKKPLSQGATPSVQAELYCGVAPVGEVSTIFEFPLIDTGSGLGSGRAGGAGDSDGALKTFTDGTVLIRVRRLAAASFTSSINIIAWEEDA